MSRFSRLISAGFRGEVEVQRRGPRGGGLVDMTTKTREFGQKANRHPRDPYESVHLDTNHYLLISVSSDL